MWFLPPALAADVPAIDAPIETGARASRDAAMVFSIEDYDQLPKASYARADADVMRAILLESVGLKSYRLRGGDQLDEAGIEAELRKAASRVRRDGTLWIYGAGHGATIDGELWMLAPGATLAEPEGIKVRELVDRASATRAGRVVVVLDAGFGQLSREGHLVGSETAGALPELEEHVTLWIPTIDEENLVFHGAGHSIFTWTLAGALRGWADGLEGGGRDGAVSLGEAQTWQKETLRALGMVMTPVHEDRPVRDEPLVAGVDETGPDALTLSALALGARDMRMLQAQDRLRERAASQWAAVEAAKAAGDPQARAMAEAFVAEFERPVLSVQWTTYLPQVSLAEGALETWEEPPPEPEPEAPPEVPDPLDGTATVEVEYEEVEPEPEPEPVEAVLPPEPEYDDSCDDLGELEMPAMMGRLREGQIACLEQRIVDAELQTEQDKLSRVLLANAEVSGDEEALGELLKRHLEDITRSDPELCLLYALHLSKQGVELTDEVIRWVDVALENKLVWSGQQYTSRVNALLALKARSAARAWRAADQDFMAERNEDNLAIAEAARNDAKQFAREWLDFVRSAELDTKSAFSLCAETAGTKKFCDD